MIRCLASFNVDPSSTETGEICNNEDENTNVWWYQIVGNENGVLSNNTEYCSDFSSNYFSQISDELETYYSYDSDVDCATEYPDFQQCCEEFYYFEYSDISTCT